MGTLVEGLDRILRDLNRGFDPAAGARCVYVINRATSSVVGSFGGRLLPFVSGVGSELALFDVVGTAKGMIEFVAIRGSVIDLR